MAEAHPLLTLASRHGDFADWHRGRRRYAIWALDIARQPVLAAVARLQGRLADFLLPGYGRQPHVTLHLCGFPSREEGQADAFTLADLERQVAALAAAAPPPFAMTLGGPATFTSAAYLAVTDGEGGIARLRQALGGGGAAEGGFPYVPHATVGLYRSSFPVAAVLAAAGDGFADIVLPIDRLHLMTYETATIGGPLASAGAFDLATGHFTWSGGPCAFGDRHHDRL